MRVIKFYKVQEQFGCFSNFAPYPIEVGGVVWPTSEHFFQAQKFAGTKFEEEIRRVKSPNGPDLLVWGSSTLTSPLLGQGLVDEVVLIVYPVLLGHGKRFFAEGTPPRSFELANTQALPSGIVVNAYKFAGSLKNQGQ